MIQACASTKARVGKLITPHGLVETPVFLPVGSQATVKTLTPHDIEDIGFSIVLANTYHLYLKPGVATIKKIGGLHRFMAWERAILTDSGGYQIYSLSQLRKITDEGVIFRSHIDGSRHLLTPELAIELQEALGSDIIMTLDVCPSYDSNFEEIKQAMETTHLWAERCQRTKKCDSQALYAIVQGGTFSELRHQSAEYLSSQDFDGYAVGGLSIGEPKKLTKKITELTISCLPINKPRYLMGVGSPEDLLESIAMGVDVFDSAMPTRIARNGALFTRRGRMNIRNASYHQVKESVDPDCNCPTCSTFSSAYMHHLFSCNELLAYRLATIHNLNFIARLMEKARCTILDGTFDYFKNDFLSNYQITNEQVRIEQKKKWLKTRR